MNIDKDIERCKELIKTEHSNWIGMTNQDAISNVLSDRETWKKIAEKLAEDKIIPKCKNCSDEDTHECTECALDWARKEVENE